MRECETGKVSHAFDLFCALAVCDGHQIEVLGFVNILQRLTIEQEWLGIDHQRSVVADALLCMLTAAAWWVSASSRSSAI